MTEYQSQTEPFSAAQPTELDGEPPEPKVLVLIANEQSTLAIDESQLQAAVLSVFRESMYTTGIVSVAVVDDPTIHKMNRRYLEHDYPTDVLSFVLEDRPPHLEGELVVSADTASRNAAEYGWSASSELLLYVIHGAAHLVGYRDKQPDEIAAMRAVEEQHLRELGVALPEGCSRRSGGQSAGELGGEAPLS